MRLHCGARKNIRHACGPCWWRGVVVAVVAVVLVGGNCGHVDAAPIPPWTTHGPPAEDVLSLAVDPVTPGTVYAGAELGRIFKSTDGGQSWQPLDTGLLTGINALLITADAGRIYAGTSNGLFVSPDAGGSWNPAGLDATVVNSLVIDPNMRQLISAGAGGGGGDQGVFQGTVDGTQWAPLTDGLPDTVVRVVAVNPAQPQHIVPGALFAATDAGLFRIAEPGAPWVQVDTGLPDAAVNVITPDPRNYFTVYVGTDAGVFVSTDSGMSWQGTDPGFTSAVSSLVIDPTSGRMYAGTFGDGVFVSTDDGAHWQEFSDGLFNGVVRTLALDTRAPATLFAGTIGDGVFSTVLVAQCLGDCDGSGEVTVDEIVTMVNIDLGTADISACSAADPGNTGTVVVTQIVAAVNNALNGCAG
jgi:photosystem II stability/assembly factor-like uncharacterized protein